MVCRGKRIAFLTPEFVTECVDGGGLGNYLDRMTQALIREGHEPEVFVRSDEGPRQLLHKGVLVHRVRPANHVLAVRTAYKLIGMTGVRDPIPLVDLLSQAIGLARALRLRDDERPFDAIQSAEWQACGLMVPRRPWRRHLVRCSGLRRLYHQADGFGPERHRWRTRLEMAQLRRADAVYFPSRLGADYLQRTHGLRAHVLRPPALIETAPSTQLPFTLPRRFLFHFGQLRARKGTLWLTEALPLAWEREPHLTVVCAGKDWEQEDLRRFWRLAKDNRDRLIVLDPLRKPDLYGVLMRAEAAVLPSLVDNLPNTVIESLLLGIPVVGSDGASIDELIEPGVTGELARIGDPASLAEAMVRLWRHESAVKKGFAWDSAIAEEMQPGVAVERFLELAGLSDGSLINANVPGHRSASRGPSTG